jgi:hypothetical protein
MSLSLNIYADEGAAPPVYAGIRTQRIIQVQSAEATDMEARVKAALAEIAAYNATQPFGPIGELLLSDADLAGAGDGHTFVCTLTFTFVSFNIVSLLLMALTGATAPPQPDEFRFAFSLAGESEPSEVLFEQMINRVCSEFTVGTAPGVVLALWQATRGASKGTRLMNMMGCFPGVVDPPTGPQPPLLAGLMARGVGAKFGTFSSPLANALRKLVTPEPPPPPAPVPPPIP